MKSSAKNISLNSYDDIFSTEETREDAKREKVTDMPLSDLYPFPDHPFQVRDDDSMKETVESIKEYGVLVPAIVRPRADGGYELISGHRRKRACELAGLPTMPVIVRNLDDDAATIIMVDSNIQRENILPSERAKAYKMKLDAIKHQGQRTDLTSVQVGQKLQGKVSRDLLAENSPDSSTQIQRYIRLNELAPQLQQMVDDKKIAMTPAVELSYLKPEEQTLLLDTIESEQATPSLSQAQRLKNFSQEGHLNEDSMLAIMSEEKKPEKSDFTIKADKLQKYFPKSYTPQQMEQVIIRLLDGLRWICMVMMSLASVAMMLPIWRIPFLPPTKKKKSWQSQIKNYCSFLKAVLSINLIPMHGKHFLKTMMKKLPQKNGKLFMACWQSFLNKWNWQ